MRRVVRRPVRPLKNFFVSPRVFTTKLKYGDFWNFTSGGTEMALRTFSHNSARDPDYTGVGGGCSGWNELTSIWGSYLVLGSKIEIWGYNTCNSPLIIAVGARDSASAAYGNAITIQQASYERPDIVRHRDVVPFTTGNGYPSFRFSFYRSVRSLEGKYPSDDDYSARVNLDPSKRTYWDVYMIHQDHATASLTANINVRITYYVRFFNKKYSMVTD